MSVTVQQILSDAKRLASKLKEHDTAADSLLSQAQFVYKKIDAMKQYTDDLSELNDMEEGGLPHEELVNSIRTESRQLQEIVRENRILKAMVAEHQTALEMIMSKYRSQVSQLVAQSSANQHINNNIAAKTIEEKNVLIVQQEERIKEMMAVMSLASRLEAEEASKKEEIIGRLQVENQTLRKLLKISSDLSVEKEPDQTLAST
ncbi:FGFR1 oncogene partner 2 homolog isoform X1 [Aphis gossypii]|uniref:FGFR1 oncogene partner 2 homolog isoform X1 n=1 Tax=Aphis gossypii TaxID=80765 RepID=UPI00100EFD58|nr:FGFR1 oncogene partner 2 homolog isoform X1 [Aphis gossypii]